MELKTTLSGVTPSLIICLNWSTASSTLPNLQSASINSSARGKRWFEGSKKCPHVVFQSGHGRRWRAPAPCTGRRGAHMAAHADGARLMGLVAQRGEARAGGRAALRPPPDQWSEQNNQVSWADPRVPCTGAFGGASVWAGGWWPVVDAGACWDELQGVN